MALIIRMLTSLVKLSFLDGYRTYLAGAGAIVSGAALVLLAAGNDPHGDVEKGVEAIIAGLALIGIGGKMEKQIAAAKGSVRLLALPLVGLIGLSMLGCGDKTSVNQLTCFNSGPGMQQCIDGDGNVTASPCTTVNGSLVTSTGQACDASSSSTTVSPTPEPTGAS